MHDRIPFYRHVRSKGRSRHTKGDSGVFGGGHGGCPGRSKRIRSIPVPRLGCNHMMRRAGHDKHQSHNYFRWQGGTFVKMSRIDGRWESLAGDDCLLLHAPQVDYCGCGNCIVRSVRFQVQSVGGLPGVSTPALRRVGMAIMSCLIFPAEWPRAFCTGYRGKCAGGLLRRRYLADEGSTLGVSGRLTSRGSWASAPASRRQR